MSAKHLAHAWEERAREAEAKLKAAERARDEAQEREKELAHVHNHWLVVAASRKEEIAELEAALVGAQRERDAEKAWASVGKTGFCVHSKTMEGCAGCQRRVLEEALREAEGVIRDVLEGENGDYPLSRHHLEEMLWPVGERIDAALAAVPTPANAPRLKCGRKDCGEDATVVIRERGMPHIRVLVCELHGEAMVGFGSFYEFAERLAVPTPVETPPKRKKPSDSEAPIAPRGNDAIGA